MRTKYKTAISGKSSPSLFLGVGGGVDEVESGMAILQDKKKMILGKVYESEG